MFGDVSDDPAADLLQGGVWLWFTNGSKKYF